jgi:hypothetical protein
MSGQGQSRFTVFDIVQRKLFVDSRSFKESTKRPFLSGVERHPLGESLSRCFRRHFDLFALLTGRGRITKWKMVKKDRWSSAGRLLRKGGKRENGWKTAFYTGDTGFKN